MAIYEYLNMNPEKEHINDCVTRAISFAMDMPYEVIARKLVLVSELYDCPKLCMSCYAHLLDNVFKLPRVYADDLYPDEFADRFPFGTYLLRMNGHLMAIRDGVIYDTFDSRYYDFITDAWRVD